MLSPAGPFHRVYDLGSSIAQQKSRDSMRLGGFREPPRRVYIRDLGRGFVEGCREEEEKSVIWGLYRGDGLLFPERWISERVDGDAHPPGQYSINPHKGFSRQRCCSTPVPAAVGGIPSYAPLRYLTNRACQGDSTWSMATDPRMPTAWNGAIGHARVTQGWCRLAAPGYARMGKGYIRS